MTKYILSLWHTKRDFDVPLSAEEITTKIKMVVDVFWEPNIACLQNIRFLEQLLSFKEKLTSVFRYNTASPKAPLPRVRILVYGSSDALPSLNESSAIM